MFSGGPLSVFYRETYTSWSVGCNRRALQRLSPQKACRTHAWRVCVYIWGGDAVYLDAGMRFVMEEAELAISRLGANWALFNERRHAIRQNDDVGRALRQMNGYDYVIVVTYPRTNKHSECGFAIIGCEVITHARSLSLSRCLAASHWKAWNISRIRSIRRRIRFVAIQKLTAVIEH